MGNHRFAFVPSFFPDKMHNSLTSPHSFKSTEQTRESYDSIASDKYLSGHYGSNMCESPINKIHNYVTIYVFAEYIPTAKLKEGLRVGENDGHNKFCEVLNHGKENPIV